MLDICAEWICEGFGARGKCSRARSCFLLSAIFVEAAPAAGLRFGGPPALGSGSRPGLWVALIVLLLVLLSLLLLLVVVVAAAVVVIVVVVVVVVVVIVVVVVVIIIVIVIVIVMVGGPLGWHAAWLGGGAARARPARGGEE